MQVGNFNVDSAIEAAKKRLHASIYGHEKARIVLHPQGNGFMPRITIGEYEIEGLAFIDMNMNQDSGSFNVIGLAIYSHSIEIAEITLQGTSRK